VHSTKRRHQSPEWTILSHVNYFIQGEVIGFQVLLDSLHPRSMRASWWSPPVLQEEAKTLASVLFGILTMWLNREKCRAWTKVKRCACLVVHLTSSFHTWWYHEHMSVCKVLSSAWLHCTVVKWLEIWWSQPKSTPFQTHLIAGLATSLVYRGAGLFSPFHLCCMCHLIVWRTLIRGLTQTTVWKTYNLWSVSMRCVLLLIVSVKRITKVVTDNYWWDVNCIFYVWKTWFPSDQTDC